MQDSYNSGPFKSKIVCPLALAVSFHQSCHVTKARVYLNWHQRRQTCWVLRRVGWRSAHRHTATSNVPPPSMFAMMHLRNVRQVSIEEVRQVMTRSPFACQSSAFDRNSERRRLKIRQLELRTPCEKFLATPLLTESTCTWQCDKITLQ